LIAKIFLRFKKIHTANPSRQI